MATGWDSSKLKKLKALVGKGLSTSEIGRRLEMSKNAVVGKLNRLGWNLKATSGVATKNNTKTAGETGSKKSKTTVTKKVAPVKPVVMSRAGKIVAKKTTKTTKETSKSASGTKADEKPVLKHLPRASGAGKKGDVNLAMHQRIIQHSLEMASLKPNQCRWPIGDPDSENFHFCGEPVFVGKPYCYEHCRQAYQFTTPPKKK